MKNISLILDWVSCIYYPVQFKNNEIWALINSGGEINVMTSTYVAKLSLKVCRTNVRAQKIDGSTFETFEMVLVSFQVEDQLKKACFF